MAMYTSCGWFFDDIAGIETVQCIRYAARCCQLLQGFAGEDLEGRLVTALDLARSNIGHDTAATAYRNWVQPEIRTARRVANAHHFSSSTFSTRSAVCTLQMRDGESAS